MIIKKDKAKQFKQVTIESYQYDLRIEI